MLLMVIERFRNGDIAPVAERFRKTGRMLPEGLIYHASWIDLEGTRCYQLMETDSREVVDRWVAHWSDLVDFEIIPVLSSQDFWARRG